MRRKLIAGNWKMNGSLSTNASLIGEIKSCLGQPACDVAICVPAPYFAQCQSLLDGSALGWGGQDVSVHDSGAYTGEVSVSMLADFGCRYAIVGHSERRTYHGESDDLVARKAVAVLKRGLVPIVCVGESLGQREAGDTAAVVGAQLDAVLAAIAADDLSRVVVAYEPVWAIGTGKTATPQMAQDVHSMLRSKLREKNPSGAAEVKILYGGSMKPENAAELLAMPDIDGGLIGGASLKASDFLSIIRAA